uniref:Uncharacterized protein n=1 Tax=viral metagenome TaxID=1070528 RepID=A0A6M3L6C8_9ZZZZ
MNRRAGKLFEALFRGFEWQDIINCTPHPISVWAEVESNKMQEVFCIKPSGILPRVSIIETEHPDVHKFPFYLVKNKIGKVEGMPENDTGERIFIVSRMVFDASDRKDIICPDTGKTAIRDDDGKIIGVTQFVGK